MIWDGLISVSDLDPSTKYMGAGFWFVQIENVHRMQIRKKSKHYPNNVWAGWICALLMICARTICELDKDPSTINMYNGFWSERIKIMHWAYIWGESKNNPVKTWAGWICAPVMTCAGSICKLGTDLSTINMCIECWSEEDQINDPVKAMSRMNMCANYELCRFNMCAERRSEHEKYVRQVQTWGESKNDSVKI